MLLIANLIMTLNKCVFLKMCCVKLAYSKAILVTFPKSVKAEFIRVMPGPIWNFLTNDLDGEATVIILTISVVTRHSPLRATQGQSQDSLDIKVTADTSFAMYQN